MNGGRAQTSLSELRRKTDRQLVALVQGEIEKSRRSPSPDAELVYAEARKLIAVVPPSQRAELEIRLQELRRALDNRETARSCSCTAA